MAKKKKKKQAELTSVIKRMGKGIEEANPKFVGPKEKGDEKKSDMPRYKIAAPGSNPLSIGGQKGSFQLMISPELERELTPEEKKKVDAAAKKLDKKIAEFGAATSAAALNEALLGLPSEIPAVKEWISKSESGEALGTSVGFMFGAPKYVFKAGAKGTVSLGRWLVEKLGVDKGLKVLATALNASDKGSKLVKIAEKAKIGGELVAGGVGGEAATEAIDIGELVAAAKRGEDIPADLKKRVLDKSLSTENILISGLPVAFSGNKLRLNRKKMKLSGVDSRAVEKELALASQVERFSKIKAPTVDEKKLATKLGVTDRSQAFKEIYGESLARVAARKRLSGKPGELLSKTQKMEVDADVNLKSFLDGPDGSIIMDVSKSKPLAKLDAYSQGLLKGSPAQKEVGRKIQNEIVKPLKGIDKAKKVAKLEGQIESIKKSVGKTQEGGGLLPSKNTPLSKEAKAEISKLKNQIKEVKSAKKTTIKDINSRLGVINDMRYEGKFGVASSAVDEFAVDLRRRAGRATNGKLTLLNKDKEASRLLKDSSSRMSKLSELEPNSAEAARVIESAGLSKGFLASKAAGSAVKKLQKSARDGIPKHLSREAGLKAEGFDPEGNVRGLFGVQEGVEAITDKPEEVEETGFDLEIEGDAEKKKEAEAKEEEASLFGEEGEEEENLFEGDETEGETDLFGQQEEPEQKDHISLLREASDEDLNELSRLAQLGQQAESGQPPQMDPEQEAAMLEQDFINAQQDKAAAQELGARAKRGRNVNMIRRAEIRGKLS